MRNPIMREDEKITMRGRCANLRLFIIKRPFTVAGGGGFRWAALSSKTNIGAFAYFSDSPGAFKAMETRIREFHPKAMLYIR